MPNPAPRAEDIDEDAARRSIRVTVTVMSALLLLAGLGGVLFSRIIRQVDHRPTGTHHDAPAWAVVLLVTCVVVLVAVTVWRVRRQFRRPAYRRVMQYGWRRRRRVAKDLSRGRSLSAEDMPVAAAMVNQVRSQRRSLVILFVLLPCLWLFNGLVQHGSLRWFELGFAGFWIVFSPVLVRQQRRIIRNYERQNDPTAGNLEGPTSSTSG